MISILIFIIFAIALIRNFEKAFIVMMAIYTLIFQFKVPGLPLDLFSLLSVFSFFVFIMLKYNVKNAFLKTAPVKLSLILIFISYFISNYYGAYKHYSLLLSNAFIIFNLFIFNYIICKKPQYIKVFIRTCYFGGR